MAATPLFKETLPYVCGTRRGRRAAGGGARGGIEDASKSPGSWRVAGDGEGRREAVAGILVGPRDAESGRINF